MLPSFASTRQPSASAMRARYSLRYGQIMRMARQLNPVASWLAEWLLRMVGVVSGCLGVQAHSTQRSAAAPNAYAVVVDARAFAHNDRAGNGGQGG